MSIFNPEQSLLFSIQNILDLSPLKQHRLLFANLDLPILEKNPLSSMGRPGFLKKAVFRALVHRNLKGIPNLEELAQEMNDNLSVAQACGFDILKPLPSHDRYSRFLRDTPNQIFQKIRTCLVKELIKEGHVFGNYLSIDSMPIIANVKQNNPKIFVKNRFDKSNLPKADKDARLGIIVIQPDSLFPIQLDFLKQLEQKRKIMFFWGYRNHVVTDCLSELPIAEITKPANVHDSKLFIPVFNQVKNDLSLSPHSVLADSAHDALYIRQFIYGDLEAVAFIPPNPRGGIKEPKLSSSGKKICIAGFPLQYWGRFKDRGRIRFKYVCPITHSKRFAKEHPLCPMYHPNFLKGKGCIVYTYNRYSDIPPQPDPNSDHFKTVYRLRTSSERVFSKFLNFPIHRPPVKGLTAVSNLITIAHITILLLALTAVRTGDILKMRQVKGLLRQLSKS